VTPPNSPASQGALRSLSILIVDDEPVIRRVAELALVGAGHTVMEAGDSAAASELIHLRKTPFDLVLLDRTLPDGEGTALIPTIRRIAPSTRILVVSGLGDLDASSVGANGFLAKPFTRSSLLAAVSGAIAAGPE
jgi:two-component system cell cycle response regulator CtrA